MATAIPPANTRDVLDLSRVDAGADPADPPAVFALDASSWARWNDSWIAS